MIQYTTDMHTGTNTWNYQESGLVTRKVWITCNGERLDMTSTGYPTPYLTLNSTVLQVLEIMENRERRADRHTR
jgi:hypothetical protein